MTRMSLLTGLRLMAVGAALGAIPGDAQQTSSAAKQQAFSAGDIYLPSSRVYALVGKTGFGHEHAVTGSLSSGRLKLGATHDAGELVFDMKSFVADTDAARRFVRLEGTSSQSTQHQVTENMLSSAVLNVAKYPTARYRIDSAIEQPEASPDGAKRYRLAGDFTLLGVRRPLVVTAEVDVKNGWNRVRGSFRLKQTDFGMKPFTKAFGAVGVADEMSVWGEFWVAPSTGVANRATSGTR